MNSTKIGPEYLIGPYSVSKSVRELHIVSMDYYDTRKFVVEL